MRDGCHTTDGASAAALHVVRVRLAALAAEASAGGEVSTYQIARALEPILGLVLAVGREEGRWHAARSLDLAVSVAEEREARALYGPGAVEPGEQAPRAASRPRALPPRGAPRPPASGAGSRRTSAAGRVA